MRSENERLGLLADSAKCGDRDALNELVISMGGLADRVAASYAYRISGGESYKDDYRSEAMVGLLGCLDTFERESGSFYPYAESAMRMAVRSFVSNKQRVVRQPKHVTEKISKINKILESYESSGMDSPGAEVIAMASGLSEMQVKKTLLVRNIQNIYSLDYSYSDEDDARDTLMDSFIADNSVEEGVYSRYMQDRLEKAVFELNERDRRVLCSEDGAFGYEKKSPGALARDYNVTTATIRNWRNKIKDKLRYTIC